MYAPATRGLRPARSTAVPVGSAHGARRAYGSSLRHVHVYGKTLRPAEMWRHNAISAAASTKTSAVTVHAVW